MPSACERFGAKMMSSYVIRGVYPLARVSRIHGCLGDCGVMSRNQESREQADLESEHARTKMVTKVKSTL